MTDNRLVVLASTPDYAHGHVGPVYIAFWRTGMTPDGMRLLETELPAHVARHPKGCATLVVIEPEAVLPSPEIRERLSKLVPTMPEIIADGLVFEGAGLKRTMIRAISTMLGLLLTRAGGMETFGSIEAAATWLEKKLATTPTPLFAFDLVVAARELRAAAPGKAA